MKVDQTELALTLYVNKASDLAECLRHDIQHNDSKVSTKTILALNTFIIAANQIKDLTDIIDKNSIKLN